MNRLILKRESNALVSYCYKEKTPCVGWVQTYLSDCLCNFSDRLSFGLGLVSVVAWAVAEIPQIITNFRTKSSHGISILFLITWVLGDVFNVAGCLLEPATLPTQYYTALFYTATTLVLVLQSLYYDHLYTWWKCRERRRRAAQQDEELKAPLNPNKPEEDGGGGGIPIPSSAPHISQLPRPITASKEFYYTSARSLAGSNTPPFRSYMRVAKSGPSATALGEHHYSSEDENEPTAQIAVPVKTHPRSIPRLAARGAMIAAASFNLPTQSNAMVTAHKGFTGRRFLQERDVEYGAFGQYLGWMMAAIYMGGRIPQIALNIKRGSVEGLNPLMFIFALVGNVTYVASILVRSTEWERIKANLPWLLDAVVCVALDLFIILQYVYYQYLRKDIGGDDDDDKGYCVEVRPKAFVA